MDRGKGVEKGVERWKGYYMEGREGSREARGVKEG